MRVVRWLVAVERDAQARHIEMRFWEAINGRRVVAVNDARVDARSLERAHALDETVDLDLEIERFGGIGSCEMREAPLQIERSMEADLRDEFDHLIVAHANAIHAGVDGQMKRCFQVVRVGNLGVVDREVGRVYRRDDAIMQQQWHAFDGRLRQKQENGSRKSALRNSIPSSTVATPKYDAPAAVAIFATSLAPCP